MIRQSRARLGRIRHDTGPRTPAPEPLCDQRRLDDARRDDEDALVREIGGA